MVKKKKRKKTKKIDLKRYDNKEKHLKELHHHLNVHKTFGQKAADVVTTFAGSWVFIISFLTFLVIWMAVNVLMWIRQWDPYPFILLNLVLSCLAALQAPIILMSQNREADRDRIRAERDFLINRKAEREIEDIQKDLKGIRRLMERK